MSSSLAPKYVTLPLLQKPVSQPVSEKVPENKAAAKMIVEPRTNQVSNRLQPPSSLYLPSYPLTLLTLL
jgi:hypothetical protein